MSTNLCLPCPFRATDRMPLARHAPAPFSLEPNAPLSVEGNLSPTIRSKFVLRSQPNSLNPMQRAISAIRKQQAQPLLSLVTVCQSAVACFNVNDCLEKCPNAW